MTSHPALRFKSIAARPAPARAAGGTTALQRQLFSSLPNTLLTLFLFGVFAWLALKGFSWGVVHAVFAADADQCQMARGVGACWGVINEKARFILSGRYPQSQQWRPVLATFALLLPVLASCNPRLWKPSLVLIWVGGVAVFAGLMGGGFAGLSPVERIGEGSLAEFKTIILIPCFLILLLSYFCSLNIYICGKEFKPYFLLSLSYPCC